MNGQHTQGRLEVRNTPDGPTLIRERSDWATGSILEDSRDAHGTISNEADARRLAACWNACEGMPVEHIEALAVVGTMGNLYTHARDQLAAARALLAGILAEAEGWHDECRGTPLDSGIADEVRAFLKGGA